MLVPSARFTDAEQRATERLEAERIVREQYPGTVQCRGYPADHYCIVLLASHGGKTLCRVCDEKRYFAMKDAAQRSTGMARVGEIFEDLPPFASVGCLCGGNPDFPEHEISLLHVRWLAGERLRG